MQTTGTQILNPALYDKDKTVNGVTFTKQADGSVILTGKSTGASTFYLGEYVDVLEDGKTYIYGSGSPLGVINITYNDGTSNGYLNVITVDKSRMVSIKPYIQFNIEKPPTNNMRILPMFNEGTVIKPWEPYTGGNPSPSMEYPQEILSAGDNGKIEVEVFGTNICPVSSETTNFMTFTKVYPGVPYSICAKQSIPTALNIMIVEENDTFAKNPIEVFNTLQFVKGVITFEPTKTGYVYVNSYKETEYSGVCIYAGTLLEYQYEPYKPAQTLTLKTPNGLPGIPVKSGGNYTDSTGQQWITDEIDLSREERVQRIKSVNAKDLDWKLDPTGNIKRFSVNGIPDIRKNGALMSNRFVRTSYASADNSCSNEENGKLRIVINSTIDTVDKVKQLFSENDTVFYYELLDPLITPLSPEEIAAYKSLQLYSPNTIITNDAGCEMSLTYTVDTKKYVDKKIAAISAAE